LRKPPARPHDAVRALPESSVIRPEQLVEALDRIHPRDREMLSLSLRRRVPDEALAELYDCEPTDVARRRARAIERLADEMDLQRGEDLGAVLKALLEPETWSSVAAPVGEEFAADGGRGRLAPVPPPDDSPTPPPPLAPVPPPENGERPPRDEPSPTDGEGPRGDQPPLDKGDRPRGEEPPLENGERRRRDELPPTAGERPRSEQPPRTNGDRSPSDESQPAAGEPGAGAGDTAAAPAGDATEGQPEAATDPPAPASAAPSPEPADPPATEAGPARAPDSGITPTVAEMVAAREREAPDPPRRAVPLALFGLGIAALVGGAGVVGATQFGDANPIVQSTTGGGDDDDTRHFIPAEGGPLAAPFPTDPSAVSCYSTAYLPRATVLYRQAGGHRRFKITPRTEWGSPRVLGVVEQRGGWLGVQAPELRNGEIAWIRRREARLDCVRWSLHADLSKRTLFVRRDGRTVRKMRVAVGRPQNPTPKGRFTVTDKLRVTDGDSAYGCCVLALTGHQTDLPEYWPGGDRLAVHATSDESSIGRPVSLGCLRTEARRARWLIETVPLGSPVFIRA
jgi:L,D-transpeptidase catalytic domain